MYSLARIFTIILLLTSSMLNAVWYPKSKGRYIRFNTITRDIGRLVPGHIIYQDDDGTWRLDYGDKINRRATAEEINKIDSYLQKHDIKREMPAPIVPIVEIEQEAPVENNDGAQQRQALNHQEVLDINRFVAQVIVDQVRNIFREIGVPQQNQQATFSPTSFHSSPRKFSPTPHNY